MTINDIIRPLKVGDVIKANYERVRITKILSQDCYRDRTVEFALQRGLDPGEDRSYIDIEFLDDYGKYRRWRSHLDGGVVEYLDVKNKDFNSRTLEWCEKSLNYIVKNILKGQYSVEKDVLMLVSYEDYWLLFCNDRYLGYVNGFEKGEERSVYNFADICKYEVEQDYYAVIYPTGVESLGNETLTIYKNKFDWDFFLGVPRTRDYTVKVKSDSEDFKDAIQYSKKNLKNHFWDVNSTKRMIERNLDIDLTLDSDLPKVDVNIGVENILYKVSCSLGKAIFYV